MPEQAAACELQFSFSGKDFFCAWYKCWHHHLPPMLSELAVNKAFCPEVFASSWQCQAFWISTLLLSTSVKDIVRVLTWPRNGCQGGQQSLYSIRAQVVQQSLCHKRIGQTCKQQTQLRWTATLKCVSLSSQAHAASRAQSSRLSATEQHSAEA